MKVLITGSTGMVGRAILIECLESSKVTEILVLNRRAIQVKDKKLKEILIEDFFHLDHIDFTGFDACFHAMGVSSLGMKEDDYHTLTFEVTKALVEKVKESSSDAVFNYVSGQGTDSTESGRSMWARVKGKTENMILNAGFKDAYMFRIGGLIPEKGVKSKTTWVNATYFLFRPLMQLLRKPFSLIGSSMVGAAMIDTVLSASEKKILTNRDIQERLSA